MAATILSLLCLQRIFSATQQFTVDSALKDVNFWNRIARDNINRKFNADPRQLETKKPKNIILFIGDGMGVPIVTSARINKNQVSGKPYLNEPLFFENFRSAGLVKTSSLSHHVTDSAAGAVALVTGRKVTSTTLGWKPNSLTGKENCTNDRSRHITDGIAEGALQKGLAVGFVTNTRVTHATPASLYAKGVHRNIENDRNAKAMRADCPDIARQLLSYPASEFKVLMGGGVENLLNTSRGGERRDGRNIDIEWSRLGGRRRVLRNENDLLAVTPSDEKLLGIFAKSHLPMYIQEQVMGTKKVPRLMEMTAKAIEQLQHGEQGFFLMVEGGIIDIAEHQNLINVAFAELYEFDEAIRKAREITDPTETLIIVTADHDHAFTLPGYLPVEERIIGNSITEHKNGDGAGLYEVPGVLFVGGPGFDGDALKIDKNVAQRPKIAGPFYRPPTPVPMPNGPHGGVDVGIWADGPYSELFSSTIENTEVAYIIKFLLCTNNTDYTICDASGSSHHFTKRIVDRVGPNAIVLIGALLIAMTILSILVAVVVIVLLVMQRRSHSRNLDLNDESFGSGSKSPV